MTRYVLACGTFYVQHLICAGPNARPLVICTALQSTAFPFRNRAAARAAAVLCLPTKAVVRRVSAPRKADR